MFSFAHTALMIEAGYQAASETLDRAGDSLLSRGGVYPLRTLELAVDRDKCIGCRLCASLAPYAMEMDDAGKARVIQSPVEWSRADGDFVHQCPTEAISVSVIEGNVRRITMQRRIEIQG